MASPCSAHPRLAASGATSARRCCPPVRRTSGSTAAARTRVGVISGGPAALSSAHDVSMQCSLHGTNRVPCMPLPATPPGFIDLLPACPCTAGRSLFEKQISGLFLGELARRILLRCGAECALPFALQAIGWNMRGRRDSPLSPATTSIACATELLPALLPQCTSLQAGREGAAVWRQQRTGPACTAQQVLHCRHGSV